MERNVLYKRSLKTSIELPILINLVAINITGSVLSNVVLYRTCVHSLNHAEAVCESFLSPVKSNETHALEEAVQQHASLVISVKTVLEYIGPAILSMFMGVWSDTYGRKPLIVWPIFGMTCTGMLCVIYSMMDSLGPWWFIATSVPFSLTGGYVVMFTGAYCYVSDISTNKNTSIRMTMIDATTALGAFIGSLISSYLILAIGNVYLLLLAATLNVIAYVYINIVIVESLTGAVQGGGSRVLDILLVKEMFRECFKARPNNMRAQIILITIVKAVSIVILYGVLALEYMYSREKLHWALRDYTVYSSITTVITFAGGFLGVVVVQRLFRIGDILFSILSLLTSTGEFMIKFFATSSKDMYIGSTMSMFKGLLGPLTRSHLSKALPVEDIAKVFGFSCALESLSPIIAPILYNTLYAATVATNPGVIYILSAVLSTFSAVLLAFVLYFSCNKSVLPTYERLNTPTVTNDD